MKPNPARSLLEKYIRRLVRARGWTLIELADRAGVGRETIYRMFKNRSPRFDTLRKVARALDTTPGAILDGTVVTDAQNVADDLHRLVSIGRDLKPEALIRVLWYARYERDVNSV